MYPDPNLTLADQMHWMVSVFLKMLAPEAGKRRIGLVSAAIWNRVRKFERRFCALYAMWKAGTLPPARPSAASAGKDLDRGERREAQREAAPNLSRPAGMLPRGVRWLQALVPSSAACLAGWVESLILNFPEMKEFVAACPQVGRTLRPLIGMAGLKVPDYLALPKRVRVRKGRAAVHPPPQPSPARGEGEKKRRRRRYANPREEAAAAIRRCHATGEPVDPKTISWKAFQYVLHWPREPPDAEAWR